MTFQNPDNNSQLAREARIGFTVVAILLCVFVFVAYKRISGSFKTYAGSAASLAPLEITDEEVDSEPDLWGKKEDNDLSFNLDDEPSTGQSSGQKKQSKNKSQWNKRNQIASDDSNSTAQPKSESPGIVDLTEKVGLPKVNGGHTDNVDSNNADNELVAHDQVYKQFPVIGPDSESVVSKSDTTKSFSVNGVTTPGDSELPPKLDDSGVNIFAQVPGHNPGVGNSSPETSLPLNGFSNQFSPDNNHPTEIKNRTDLPNQNQLVDNGSQKTDSFKGLQAPNQFDIDGTAGNGENPLKNDLRLTPGDDKNAVVGSNVRKIPEVDTAPTNTVQLATGQFDPGKPNKIDDGRPVGRDPAKSHFPRKKNGNGRSDQKLIPPCRVVADNMSSFWSISQDAYGDGNFFRALHQHNLTTMGVTEIKPGVGVDVPTLETLKKKFPAFIGFQQELSGDVERRETRNSRENGTNSRASTNGKSSVAYISKQGETVFSIAAEHLGQAARYVEILEINRGTLPRGTNQQTRLPAGLRIQLPAR